MSGAGRFPWKKVYDLLYGVYGDCACPLRHETPFQLLAAVMLSAQCRDERVNQVTEKLFAVAPDPRSMAALSVDDIAEIVHTCGLFRNKSENLHRCAEILLERYDGEVPQSMEELTSLPGIGRKSANVLLGNSFGIPGFPVDTHVNRVLNRLGAVNSASPEKIEKAACAAVEPEKWCNFSHLLIQHGRNVCFARKPNCKDCVLCGICSGARG